MKTELWHVMKDGTRINVRDMSDKHLINTIAMMHRRAEVGLLVLCGGVSTCNDEPWFDEVILHGADALKEMKTRQYEAEAARRGLEQPAHRN
jgi:hypothetical protein